jgi:protein-tyrosine phosphatase
MQYVPWIAKFIEYGGLVLIACAFAPIGQGRSGLLRHPWLLAYGILVFILGSLIGVAYMQMMRPYG